jgi:hypothetical protein
MKLKPYLRMEYGYACGAEGERAAVAECQWCDKSYCAHGMRDNEV